MLTFLILSLAVWEIIEIWHHSALFATTRARLELQEGFVPTLLLCPFCLAPWVAFFVCQLMFWAPRYGFVYTVVSAFAVARAANVLNDLTYKWHKTPNAVAVVEPATEESEAQ